MDVPNTLEKKTQQKTFDFQVTARKVIILEERKSLGAAAATTGNIGFNDNANDITDGSTADLGDKMYVSL